MEYRTGYTAHRGKQRRKKGGLAVRFAVLLVLLLVCVRIGGMLFRSVPEGAGLGDALSTGGSGGLGLDEGKYPESLLELMERNPETEQFVLDYPEKKDSAGKIRLAGEIEKGKIPLFLQWDERWGYRKYGGDFMALNGCGPTCLSMVRCGLSGDSRWNPFKTAKMSEEKGYYVRGEGTSWSLMTSGAETVGLTVHTVTFSEEGIKGQLAEGRPIICVVGPGDFTTTGHFLVLTGISGNGEICVHDPNSRERSGKTWPAEVLVSQIRNLWAYSYEPW